MTTLADTTFRFEVKPPRGFCGRPSSVALRATRIRVRPRARGWRNCILVSPTDRFLPLNALAAAVCQALTDAPG
jgi:hypothetical protein